MDRKKLYQNARKAYRLLYEVQDSLVGIVEYISSEIKVSKYGGRPLFSKAVKRHSAIADGYAPDKIGQGMWSWDYFSTYMYMYYYELMSPSDTQHCIFSIIQVMDDGFKDLLGSTAPPSTRDFISPEDSESYLLFAFSLYNDGQRPLWFDFDGIVVNDDDERPEVLRINKEISEKGKPYITALNERHFIVMKVPLEEIGNKVEADGFLHKFSDLVIEQNNYHLLIGE